MALLNGSPAANERLTSGVFPLGLESKPTIDPNERRGKGERRGIPCWHRAELDRPVIRADRKDDGSRGDTLSGHGHAWHQPACGVAERDDVAYEGAGNILGRGRFDILRVELGPRIPETGDAAGRVIVLRLGEGVDLAAGVRGHRDVELHPDDIAAAVLVGPHDVTQEYAPVIADIIGRMVRRDVLQDEIVQRMLLRIVGDGERQVVGVLALVRDVAAEDELGRAGSTGRERIEG